jgi:cytochrome c-type biogenesis protein CcmH
MFWIVLVILCLLAVVFAVWPLWRKSHRLTPVLASVVVFTVAVSVGLYDRIGSPGVPSGRSQGAQGMGHSGDLPGMEEAVASLKERLANNPEDVEGWKMLGRTQSAMRDFAGTVDSLERAVELENGQNADTLVNLAIGLVNRDGGPLEGGRPVALLENALKLDANNQPALFYMGMAFANRNDTENAATLWERLLALGPPQDVRGILEQNIAAWRGEQPPAMSTAAEQPTDQVEAPVPEDAVVSARISLSEEAVSAMSGNAAVFIIARDPNAPSPPIAVARRMLSDLPAVVSLTDAQSMVEGRNLSAFAEIELLARVSLSGGPAAQSGDWFGSMIVRPAENNSVFLTINQKVP